MMLWWQLVMSWYFYFYFTKRTVLTEELMHDIIGVYTENKHIVQPMYKSTSSIQSKSNQCWITRVSVAVIYGLLLLALIHSFICEKLDDWNGMEAATATIVCWELILNIRVDCIVIIIDKASMFLHYAIVHKCDRLLLYYAAYDKLHPLAPIGTLCLVTV